MPWQLKKNNFVNLIRNLWPNVSFISLIILGELLSNSFKQYWVLTTHGHKEMGLAFHVGLWKTLKIFSIEATSKISKQCHLSVSFIKYLLAMLVCKNIVARVWGLASHWLILFKDFGTLECYLLSQIPLYLLDPQRNLDAIFKKNFKVMVVNSIRFIWPMLIYNRTWWQKCTMLIYENMKLPY